MSETGDVAEQMNESKSASLNKSVPWQVVTETAFERQRWTVYKTMIRCVLGDESDGNFLIKLRLSKR